jgi:hypothetical protein
MIRHHCTACLFALLSLAPTLSHSTFVNNTQHPPIMQRLNFTPSSSRIQSEALNVTDQLIFNANAKGFDTQNGELSLVNIAFKASYRAQPQSIINGNQPANAWQSVGFLVARTPASHPGFEFPFHISAFTPYKIKDGGRREYFTLDPQAGSLGLYTGNYEFDLGFDLQFWDFVYDDTFNMVIENQISTGASSSNPDAVLSLTQGNPRIVGATLYYRWQPASGSTARPPGNTRTQLVTGSPASLSQNVTVPNQAFEISFDYLFQTAFGSLSVWVDDVLVATLVADANAAQQNDFTRATFTIDQSAILLKTNASLSITLDGNTGASVLIDNIVFPSLLNGDFESGDLSGFTSQSSGAGAVFTVIDISETAAAQVEDVPFPLWFYLLLPTALYFSARLKNARSQ